MPLITRAASLYILISQACGGFWSISSVPSSPRDSSSIQSHQPDSSEIIASQRFLDLMNGKIETAVNFELTASELDQLPFKSSHRDSSCFARVVTALNAQCDESAMDEDQSSTAAIILTLCLEHSARQSIPQECSPFNPGQAMVPSSMSLGDAAAMCARALHRSPQAWSTYSDNRASIARQCHIIARRREQDDLKELIINSNRDLSSLFGTLKSHATQWASTQNQFPQQFSNAMHDVLLQYEVEAARRERARADLMSIWQQDLAIASEKRWKSDIARSEEWAVNITAIFAAFIADQSMAVQAMERAKVELDEGVVQSLGLMRSVIQKVGEQSETFIRESLTTALSDMVEQHQAMSSQVAVTIYGTVRENLDVLIRDLTLHQDMTNQLQLSILKQWEDFNTELDRMHKTVLASVDASDTIIDNLHRSHELAEISNARQIEVNKGLEDILDSIDEIMDFFSVLTLWKVVIFLIISFFALIGLASSIADFLGPLLQWCLRKVWAGVSRLLRCRSSGTSSVVYGASNTVTPPIQHMDDQALPTNDFAPTDARMPLLADSAESSVVQTFSVDLKPLVSLSSKSTCLKKEVLLGETRDVTPRQPLTSTNSYSSSVTPGRTRFQPSLLTHDENASTEAFNFTSARDASSPRPAKNKYLRAQSVPVVIRF